MLMLAVISNEMRDLALIASKSAGYGRSLPTVEMTFDFIILQYPYGTKNYSLP